MRLEIPLSGHLDQADGALGVALGLCVEDEGQGVVLGREPRGGVVAVAHPLRVVGDEDCRFQDHFELTLVVF